MTRDFGNVKKGWGSEEIWVSNDLYCAKYMHFNEGGRSSMHFHKEKHETWRVLSGKFNLITINTRDSSRKIQVLWEGAVVEIPPLQPHQILCYGAGTILEVSTPDSVEDNYRIIPGDSQE